MGAKCTSIPSEEVPNLSLLMLKAVEQELDRKTKLIEIKLKIHEDASANLSNKADEYIKKKQLLQAMLTIKINDKENKNQNELKNMLKGIEDTMVKLRQRITAEEREIMDVTKLKKQMDNGPIKTYTIYADEYIAPHNDITKGFSTVVDLVTDIEAYSSFSQVELFKELKTKVKEDAITENDIKLDFNPHICAVKIRKKILEQKIVCLDEQIKQMQDDKTSFVENGKKLVEEQKYVLALLNLKSAAAYIEQIANLTPTKLNLEKEINELDSEANKISAAKLSLAEFEDLSTHPAEDLIFDTMSSHIKRYEEIGIQATVTAKDLILGFNDKFATNVHDTISAINELKLLRHEIAVSESKEEGPVDEFAAGKNKPKELNPDGSRNEEVKKTEVEGEGLEVRKDTSIMMQNLGDSMMRVPPDVEVDEKMKQFNKFFDKC